MCFCSTILFIAWVWSFFEKAFEQAKGAMMLVSPTEADTPALYTKEGIDADTTYIVRPAL